MNGLRLKRSFGSSGTCLDEWRVPDPFNVSLEQFVCGDSTREPEIDRIFGGELSSLLANYETQRLEQGDLVPAVSDFGYGLRIVDTGKDMGVVLVSSANEIVGAYLGCSLCVSVAHRGKGLGAELVFEFAHTFGSLPVWHLDKPAYTPAGLASHCRAWRLARNTCFLEAKKIDVGQ